jgi:hypothetical protein
LKKGIENYAVEAHALRSERDSIRDALRAAEAKLSLELESRASLESKVTDAMTQAATELEDSKASEETARQETIALKAQLDQAIRDVKSSDEIIDVCKIKSRVLRLRWPRWRSRRQRRVHRRHQGGSRMSGLGA